MNPTYWNIRACGSSPVIRFAADEFKRLLTAMDPDANFSETGAPLMIGLDPLLPQPPQVEDPVIDDAILIDVQNAAGCITGSNERSVLIAVYRFFREVGCLFLRPGRAGEYIPHKDSAAFSVKLQEKAAYRHRGITLEGSNSYENVVETIDFAPKLGFNAYFTQLFRPVFAFKRWYEHTNNDQFVPSPIANETIDRFVEDYDKQIALRGLHHHRIGHGWVSKLLGIISGAWHEPNDESEVLPERRELIAEIDGKRLLHGGSGIDTNLCYSDPYVQQLLAEEVVAYAKDHPDTRYLHFWFADQLNNQCECPRCQKARPSDFYIEILNQIDTRLTEAGLDTKIVFLIYLDLLWEPQYAKLNNPDRFVMMFAPIRRSYSVPMASDSDRKALPYKRNGFQNPTEAGGALPYLKAWQQHFKGDSFIFDYFYMWDYINDPGAYQSLQILGKDVEDYRTLGLNGLMSCQNQRVFMPNGLGMQIMGNTLWTGKAAFEQDAETYYAAAYGPDWQQTQSFLKTLSTLLDPVTLRGERLVQTPELAEQFAKVPHLVDDFLPVAERNLRTKDPVQQRSWACLVFYCEVCRKLSGILSAAAAGQIQTMDARWAELKTFVCGKEAEFQKEFDVFEFLLVWESRTLPRFRQ